VIYFLDTSALAKCYVAEPMQWLGSNRVVAKPLLVPTAYRQEL